MVNQIPHILEIKRTILSIEPELRKVFIFGSRAQKKQPDGHSDIDIGIIGMKKLSHFQLHRIEEAVDSIDMLYLVDIVDFTDRDDDFTKQALTEIEVLYEKTTDT